MYEVVKGILNLLLLFSTIWIIYRVLNAFFEKRKWSVLSWLSWGIFVAAQFYIEFRDRESSGIGMLLTMILLVFLISVTCYLKAGVKKLVVVAFLYAVWAATEMLVYTFISNLGMDERSSYDVGETLSKMLMTLFAFLVLILMKRDYRNDISFRYNVFLFLIPAGSIFVMCNQYFLMEQEVSFIFSLISFGILLLINILVFEIYLKLMLLFRRENEQTAYIRQLAFIENQIHEQSRFTEEFHKEKHDLTNQLVVIRECVETGSGKKAVEGLNRLIRSGENGYCVSRSGNTAVDAVINFKYAAAKERGIRFDLRIFIPEELPIDQCDLGIVLGNALDNAIEAAGACAEEDRRIELSMGVKKEALVLLIKNPYAHELRHSEAGELLSTKKNSQRHGYGLKSIIRTAERYSGDVLIETQDHCFRLTVIMNLPETERRVQ